MSDGAARVGALVLFCRDAARARDFYVSLGVPLEEERHDDGIPHYATDVDGVHFAIFAADSTSTSAPTTSSDAGAVLIGLEVPSVEDALAKIGEFGVDVLQPLCDVPWGRRAVVRDLDGRPLELYSSPPGPA
jgi:predicted enzyme related to lactoylglutathione lyase